MSKSISIRYIELKLGKNSKQDWKKLAQDASLEIQLIKMQKEDVYKRYPGIHGRFQQSQLDVLDIREQKACAVFDNATKMI